MKSEKYQLFKEESQEKSPDTSYIERATVNGIKMKVGWDRGWNDYVILFPQIDIVNEGLKKGVHDQLLEIGANPEVAKKVFEYAVQLAEKAPDVYSLYQEVKDFIVELPSDAER